jgi:glycosyltransferase involved in cell wall biosynthesis
MSGKRLFVCDPACVQPFGHNVVALKYFSDVFKKDFSEIVPVACQYLLSDIASRYGFSRFYRFYYEGFMEAKDSKDPALDPPKLSPLKYPDALERIATEDAIALTEHYNIGSQDIVFFPHLDFYGVLGMLNALDAMAVDRRPKLLLRFIGVMENATISYRKPFSELISRIMEAKAKGLSMAFSAETPRLADHLAIEFGEPVAVTPFPDISAPKPIPKTGPFYVYCPGSAREDKGFLELDKIFLAVRKIDPEMNIRFVTQNLPYRIGRYFQNYISQLYAIPGVEILAASISEDEMIANYEQASAILLPYDIGIYEFRGSAAMMEGVCFGRPVVTLHGSAFAEQVRYYGLGRVVDGAEEMAAAIVELANGSRGELEMRSLQARFRFISDVDSAYGNWLRSVS